MCRECFQLGASIYSFTCIENSGRIAFEVLVEESQRVDLRDMEVVDTLLVVQFRREECLVSETPVNKSGQVKEHQSIAAACDFSHLLRLILLLLPHDRVELRSGHLLLS